MLDAKHGNLDREQYLAFILSFQFTAPLLEISAEKELGLFYRILHKTYQVQEVGEKEALMAFRSEVEEFFGDSREVKESVQKRLKKDAIGSIMEWQREQSIPVLAEAFGRAIVIPSFFSFSDRRML